MTFEDYKRQVEEDARETIAEGADWYESWDDMYDALFTDDAVTAARAAENARGLAFDDDFIAEARAAGYDMELFAEGPEAVDVVARCLALGLVSGALEAAYEAARAAA